MTAITATMNQWEESQDSPEVVVNENFKTLQWSAVYGCDPNTTTGVTWGYYEGEYGDFTITAGTLTLGATATNYIVVLRSTGVISTSTSNTNWNNTASYARVYLVTTVSSVVTAVVDHRARTNGIFYVAGTFTGGTLTSALNEAPIVTIASSTTPAIFAAAGNTISMTGTTTVTGFDTIAAGAVRRVVFTGILQLTHNATSMINLTGANITTAAGDIATFLSLGSGNTRMVGYERADGTALTGGSGATELKGLTFTSDTSSQADSDPGSGLFRWNNATQSSATQLFIDNNTADAVSVSTFWASLGSAGFIYMQQADDSTKWQLWKWTATPTNGTGYYKFTVTLQASGGSIANTKTVYMTFDGAASGGGGSTQGLHEYPLPSIAWKPKGSAGCAPLATYNSSGATQPDWVTLDFDPSTIEYAELCVRLPKSWDRGTITYDVHWSHAATTTNFSVAWALRGVAIGNNEALAATFGTAQQVNDTGGTTGYIYQSPTSSALTIGGTPSAGDLIFLQVYRVANDGTNDLLAIDARLHHVTLYITTNADTDA